MSTLLDKARVVAASAPAAAALYTPSKLLAALSGAMPTRELVLPGLGIPALLVIVPTERLLDIEGDVAAAMARRKLAQTIDNDTAWALERIKRVLAEAVRDPDPKLRANPPPLAPVEDWGQLSKELLVEVHRLHEELCEEHDPSPMGDDDLELVAVIRDAVSKKNFGRLRACGARRLSAFLLSSAYQPADSPTDKSSPGPLPPAS